MKEGFLKENISSLLALICVVGAFVIFILVLTKEVKTAENTTFLILGNVSGIALLVLGYYYGSTKSATERAKTEMNKEVRSIEIKETPKPEEPEKTDK